MRQALHIFKKDVRRLHREIAGVLTLTFAFAIADIRGDSEVLQLLLGVTWWFLIARVIHAEAIPGDRQFWLTRPYDRKSLWAAKTLFALAFINLPVLVAQGAILKVAGLPVISNMAGLLWEQVLLTAVVILPAAALAALTATMVQFGLAALLLIAGGALVSWKDADRGLGALAWIPDSTAVAVILLFGCTVLFLQFLRRRTALSRALTAGGAVLASLIYLLAWWEPVFAVQSWLGAPPRESFGPSAISFDPNRRRDPYQPGVWRPRGMIRVDVPLQVTGMDLSRMNRDLDRVTVETASGVLNLSTSIEPFPQGFAMVLWMERPTFDRIKNQPVRIHATLFLTAFGETQETTFLTGGPPTDVPGVGRCFSARRADDLVSWLTCKSAFRWPALLVSARVSPDRNIAFERGFSYSPFPAELALSPVVRKGLPVSGENESPVTVLTQKPVSHFRYEFEIPEVRLEGFALPMLARQSEGR